jgi:hypothetical protein
MVGGVVGVGRARGAEGKAVRSEGVWCGCTLALPVEGPLLAFVDPRTCEDWLERASGVVRTISWSGLGGAIIF